MATWPPPAFRDPPAAQPRPADPACTVVDRSAPATGSAPPRTRPASPTGSGGPGWMTRTLTPSVMTWFRLHRPDRAWRVTSTPCCSGVVVLIVVTGTARWSGATRNLAVAARVHGPPGPVRRAGARRSWASADRSPYARGPVAGDLRAVVDRHGRDSTPLGAVVNGTRGGTASGRSRCSPPSSPSSGGLAVAAYSEPESDRSTCGAWPSPSACSGADRHDVAAAGPGVRAGVHRDHLGMPAVGGDASPALVLVALDWWRCSTS